MGEVKKEILPRWDLSDFYKNFQDPQIEADFKALDADISSFKKSYEGQVISLSGEDLFKAIQFFENIQERCAYIQSYAYLLYATHARDETILRFYQNIEERLTNLEVDLLFFTLEINRLDEENLQKKLDSSLAYYKPWINSLRLFKEYQLKDDLEKVFHEMSIPAAQSWVRLFDETLGSLKVIDGDETLTLSDALNLLSSPVPEVRQKIAEALSTSLQEKGPIFSLIYNTLMKEKNIEKTWRKYPTSQTSRHLSNQVEESVVEALVSAVVQSYPRLSHRYYNLKAHILGLDHLQYWDRNAPLFSDIQETHYTWEEGRKLVLEAYHDFSPYMAEIGKQFFDHKWIDAALYDGKDSGAFSHPTVPLVHPYILMNFYGKGRDVMTLAHELGHGIHQVLASHKGFFMADTPLTVAETASVFGEMIVFQKIMKQLKDPLQKKYLLSQKIDDMLNTVVRQVAFYMFEKEVHAQRVKGEVSLSDFGDIWISTQRQALGPAFEFEESYRIFWTYIAHFIHSPFYVYAYAFGDCLVNSLYAIYEKSPEGFSEQYVELLKAGGSKPYEELLKPFGLNPKDATFWNLGLSRIEALIQEFEDLVHEK